MAKLGRAIRGVTDLWPAERWLKEYQLAGIGWRAKPGWVDEGTYWHAALDGMSRTNLPWFDRFDALMAIGEQNGFGL
jgi:hypothetical protein